MSVEERLTTLERENKTWRRLATLLAGVLGLSIACSDGDFRGGTGERASAAGQTVLDCVRAKRFLVVDDKGEMQASLTTADDGGGMLGLGRVPGRDTPSTLITGGTDGVGSIWLYRRDGGLGTYISTNKNDDAGLINIYGDGGGVHVWNSNNKQVALLVDNSNAKDYPGGFLAIADANGNYVTGVLATKTGKH